MRVDCRPGDIVLDYCGGSGGKALGFAPFMHNKG
jgi:16S rRNA C967 or C1407 C5-methylase (RsmB/RsmF family)